MIFLLRYCEGWWGLYILGKLHFCSIICDIQLIIEIRRAYWGCWCKFRAMSRSNRQLQLKPWQSSLLRSPPQIPIALVRTLLPNSIRSLRFFVVSLFCVGAEWSSVVSNHLTLSRYFSSAHHLRHSSILPNNPLTYVMYCSRYAILAQGLTNAAIARRRCVRPARRRLVGAVVMERWERNKCTDLLGMFTITQVRPVLVYTVGIPWSNCTRIKLQQN